jgi:hypothetical protein
MTSAAVKPSQCIPLNLKHPLRGMTSPKRSVPANFLAQTLAEKGRLEQSPNDGQGTKPR